MTMTRASFSLVSLLPVSALLLGVSAVLLGACAADTGDPAGETPAPAVTPREARTLPFPGDDAAGVAGLAGRAAGVGNGNVHMVYRGGPVISNVEVFTLFWTSGVPNQSALDGFYGTIVDSAYLDGLAEYDTPTQKIGRGKYVGTYVDPSAPAGAEITDEQVQQEIARLLDAGTLPAPDGNLVIMVHFPAGVTITMQQSYTSCRQFCAYHSSFTHGQSTVYYGIMPDFSGACSSCGGEPNQFDSTTVVASHEVAEAITDPDIGVANTTGDEQDLGWYDDRNSEIGDVCQGQSVTVAGYRVTKLWSNQQNACAASGVDTGGGSCAHGVCVAGSALSASCGSCTATVCGSDAHCCSGAWDASCVSEAGSLCGKHCQ